MSKDLAIGTRVEYIDGRDTSRDGWSRSKPIQRLLGRFATIVGNNQCNYELKFDDLSDLDPSDSDFLDGGWYSKINVKEVVEEKGVYFLREKFTSNLTFIDVNNEADAIFEAEKRSTGSRTFCVLKEIGSTVVVNEPTVKFVRN